MAAIVTLLQSLKSMGEDLTRNNFFVVVVEGLGGGCVWVGGGVFWGVLWGGGVVCFVFVFAWLVWEGGGFR